ncbi:MAG: DUF6745 domain-containing protein [bacterium]
MITELTKEQEKMIEVYRDMGIVAGNSTEPANFEIADQALMELYDFSDLKRPEKIYHVDSPKMAQGLINELLKQPQDTFNSSHSYSFGSAESYWIYTYQYYIDVLKLEIDAKAKHGLDIMKRLCDNSGFHYVYDKFAIICDRPEKISLNENGEVHCEDGPAIRYRDGFEIYAINGHIVPKIIVMNPEQITKEMIQKEENAEVSRIMIEKFGLSKYLIETGAKILDMDSLSLDGSATRILVEDTHGQKWLIGSDGSTKRTYNMSAPRQAKTCKEAHSLMSGFDENKLIAES